MAKSLVREYGYPKACIAVEFTLRLGSQKPRADLVIFAPDTATCRRHFIVERKAQSVKARFHS